MKDKKSSDTKIYSQKGTYIIMTIQQSSTNQSFLKFLIEEQEKMAAYLCFVDDSSRDFFTRLYTDLYKLMGFELAKTSNYQISNNIFEDALRETIALIRQSCTLEPQNASITPATSDLILRLEILIKEYEGLYNEYFQYRKLLNGAAKTLSEILVSQTMTYYTNPSDDSIAKNCESITSLFEKINSLISSENSYPIRETNYYLQLLQRRLMDLIGYFNIPTTQEHFNQKFVDTADCYCEFLRISQIQFEDNAENQMVARNLNSFEAVISFLEKLINSSTKIDNHYSIPSYVTMIRTLYQLMLIGYEQTQDENQLMTNFLMIMEFIKKIIGLNPVEDFQSMQSSYSDYILDENAIGAINSKLRDVLSNLNSLLSNKSLDPMNAKESLIELVTKYQNLLSELSFERTRKKNRKNVTN